MYDRTARGQCMSGQPGGNVWYKPQPTAAGRGGVPYIIYGSYEQPCAVVVEGITCMHVGSLPPAGDTPCRTVVWAMGAMV